MSVATGRMTAQEFWELEVPDDALYTYELINGALVKKNTPSGEHQHAQTILQGLLFGHLVPTKKGMVYGSPTAVQLSEFNVPIPDLCVLLTPHADRFSGKTGVIGSPDLIIEIISPSSIKRDRVDKKALYEAAGVPEYWLVDPNYHTVEVFILRDSSYQLHQMGEAGEEVSSVVLPDFKIAVSSIFL